MEARTFILVSGVEEEGWKNRVSDWAEGVGEQVQLVDRRCCAQVETQKE